MPRLGSAGDNASRAPPPRGSAQANNNRSGTRQQPTQDEIFRDVANKLDAGLFEPWYHQESDTSEFEKSLCNKFTDYKSFAKIDVQLRSVKVYSVLACIICLGLSLSNFAGGRFAHVLIYAATAHDLLRVSYNCYIKRYCSRAVKRLGGNLLEAAGNVFMNAVSSALFGKPDLMSRLQEEVIWDVLFDDTFARRALDAIPKGQIKNKAD